MRRNPAWQLGVRTKYVVGTTQSPADVGLRNTANQIPKGGMIENPSFTIGKRLRSQSARLASF